MEREELLRRAARALANDVSASLADVAARVGIGRSTLHRSFATRDVLLSEVAQFALAEVDRIYVEIGLDDRPTGEVLQAMGDEVLNLATAYALLWAEPPITAVPELHDRAEAQDDRFAQFAARGQVEGCFRNDVPARWISYSIGSQAFALFVGVRGGFLGERTVKDLFLTTVVSGLGRPAEA